jgi:hypothetical protein
VNGTKQRRAPAGARSSYDRFKEFDGKRYTGMKVGRRHKWRYDPGEWMEKKVTPDKWEFTYAVKKHRAGKAPEGSGAPVGTAYRWYILANQIVTKQDANSYTTEMAGLKYKLAHKRADKESWSASDRAQRKRLAQILREMIAELEKQPEESHAAHDESRAKKSDAASTPRKADGAVSATAHRSNGSSKRARPLPAHRSTRPRTREKRAAA